MQLFVELTEKVSIIVPIYNAEKYLPACLDSILSQSYSNLEILLINDGSTDHSGEICNSVAQLDNRITVLQQENTGVAAARNLGLRKATGIYIQFIDADDMVNPLMTEKLLRHMTCETDLAICGYQYDSEILIPPIKGQFKRETFLQYFGLLYKKIILPSPCNKMYRLQLIQKHSVHFTDNYTLGEDLLFNLDYLQQCRSIYVLQENLYTYRKNSESLTNTYIPNMYDNQKALHHHVKQFLQSNSYYQGENQLHGETIFANDLLYTATNLYHENSPFSNQERKKQLTTILRDRDVIAQLPYFTDSLQARLFRYFLKRQAYQRAHIFFSCKQFIRKHFRRFFSILRYINKR